jgi:hypothetical protein
VFDEAPTIEPISEVFVEAVRVCAMIAARYLDANATVRPGEFLDCGNEHPTHAVLAKAGSDNQTRDPTEKTVGMKQGDAMKRNNTGHLPYQLGDHNRGVGRILAIRDALLNSRDGRGVTESSQ